MRRKIRPAQDPGRHALAVSEAWVDPAAVAEDGDNLPKDLVFAYERIVVRQGVASCDQMPLAMAHAMRMAVEAGRLAYKAGRIPRKLYATASSPLEGIIGS